MTAINKITLEDIKDFKTFPHVNAYQRIALKSAIYPGQGSSIGLMYVALKGAGEAGEFAEHVGKALRDDGMLRMNLPADHARGDDMKITDCGATYARRTALIKEIGDELWYCAAKCRELGITLEDAMLTNLEKLADRSARNTLSGSGDER
jgi:NTP pyrophosphatase (non-canonical NTP hydrolase)